MERSLTLEEIDNLFDGVLALTRLVWNRDYSQLFRDFGPGCHWSVAMSSEAAFSRLGTILPMTQALTSFLVSVVTLPKLVKVWWMLYDQLNQSQAGDIPPPLRTSTKLATQFPDVDPHASQREEIRACLLLASISIRPCPGGFEAYNGKMANTDIDAIIQSLTLEEKVRYTVSRLKSD